MLFAQGLDHAQDLVVGFALGQAVRQGVGEGLGLKKQMTACFAVSGGRQLEASADVDTVVTGRASSDRLA